MSDSNHTGISVTLSGDAKATGEALSQARKRLSYVEVRINRNHLRLLGKVLAMQHRTNRLLERLDNVGSLFESVLHEIPDRIETFGREVVTNENE